MPSLVYLKSSLSRWFLYRNPAVRRIYMNCVRSPYMYAMAKYELRQWKSLRKTLLTTDEVRDRIADHLENRTPFAAAKIGANEFFLTQWMLGENVLESRLHDLHHHAGVFPADLDFYREFGHVFVAALKELDLLELWSGKGEPGVYKRVGMTAEVTELPHLSAEFAHIARGKNTTWFSAMKNKRVLVISSFAELINQRANPEDWQKYWGPRLPWPAPASVKAIPFPYGFEPGTQKLYGDSLRLLEAFKERHQADLDESDLVLAGCGAYAIPLLPWVKARGKVGVHLGGNVQLLFGIKGGRWDSIDGLYNEHWVRPGESLTPRSASNIESACYW